MGQYNVAILYICIGNYTAFWEDFYNNFEEKFLVNSTKEYFVFTDAETIFAENEVDKVHKIYQDDLGWPGNTLFRFSMFEKIESKLKGFDYIFFMNANVICMKEITEDVFLPKNNALLVVQHPGWYKNEPFEFEYERNRKSRAYISYLKGEVYICGGVNGGKADAYIKLIKILSNQINKDYEDGVVARWHDESHINKYIIINKDYKMLSPSYCYPEGWDLPFEKCMMVLDKKKKIALHIDKSKGPKVKDIIVKYSISAFRHLLWAIIYKLKKRGSKL